MSDPDPAKSSGRLEVSGLLRPAGLGVPELWIRYVALGGGATRCELDRYLAGEGPLSDLDHDIVVHAMNERFAELGWDRVIPYLGTR